MKLILGLTLSGLAFTASHADAQSPIVYNAALGTLPSSQCFSLGGSTMPMQCVAGELHIGPTSAAASSYFERSNFPINFNAGFAMEATFRVVSSDCSVNLQNNLRYGIQLSATDSAGAFCAAHFCSTGVALVNTPNSPPGGPGVATAAYAVAGQTITAQVVVGPSTCTLLINGQNVLTIPRGTYLSSGPSFYFGDGTLAAGADVYVSSVRATGSTTACIPPGVVSVPSGCQGLGPLAFSGVIVGGQPVAFRVDIPGVGTGFPVMLVGLYAMQTPYCSAGCRLGLDIFSSVLLPQDTLSMVLPTTTPIIGYPFAFQGARLSGSGACPLPIQHTISDVLVLTL